MEKKKDKELNSAVCWYKNDGLQQHMCQAAKQLL